MSNAGKSVVDLRTYKIRRGGMALFLRLSETHVLPVMLRHVGAPLGYYVTVIGAQDEVTHLWGFDSVGDMETRRLARNQDPEWPRYAADSRDLIDVQETRVVRRLALPALATPPQPGPARPVVEFKVTTVRRGTMPDFLRRFEELALPAQRRHVGVPVGVYLAEIGPQNQVTQLSAFTSLADYEARIEARDRDPAWSRFQAETEPLVLAESTKTTRRVAFGAGAGS